ALAGHHARLVRGGRSHAADALVDARRTRERVRQARSYQGAAGAPCDLAARLQERGAAGRHLRRAALRRAPERLDHRRDGVWMARARAARDRSGRLARLSHRADGRAVSVGHVHQRELARRRPVRVLEPEDQVLPVSNGAAVVTDSELLARRARDRRWPPVVPLAVVALLLLCALFAPLLAPHSPPEGSLGERLAPPIGLEGAKSGHVLGTDRHGRDTLSRLLYGARISLAGAVGGGRQ